MFLSKRRLIFYCLAAFLFFAVIFFSTRPAPYVFRSAFCDISRLPLTFLQFLDNESKAVIFFHRNHWDNKKLRDENEGLKNLLLRKDVVEAENSRLRDMLSLKESSGFQSVSCSVIGRDYGLFGSYLILDRGRKDGIKKNDPVLSPAGLVGKVLETGKYSCKVILLNDPDFAVPAMGARNGEQGLVSGSLDGRCKLRFLDVNSDIAEGDIIITSGLNMTYPPNIAIGRVKFVGTESGGLSKFAIIEPALKLSSLDHVLVITSFNND